MSSRLTLARFVDQRDRWPRSGRHVLAQFDAESVVVYQAYRPEIGQFAATHGYFGGAFSLDRMSWIKPNFLWMMYRSGWGRKDGQEVVLAVWLRRAAFDAILAAAVPSSHDPRRYPDRGAWQDAVKTSDVRLQWDPDHGPSGAPVERRAVQLGLRGQVLARYAREWILAIEDISALCREQYAGLQHGGVETLSTPYEEVYPVDAAGAAALGTSPD